MAKKDVNIDLDLTPFIGLFAVLVSLLLVTAVWNKISSLNTNTSNVTASDSSDPTPPEKKVELSITILPEYLEMAEDEKGTKLSYVGRDIDMQKVLRVLQQWRQKYPDKKDVIIHSENKARYDLLIRVFDTLVGNGWPDVGVSTQ